MTGTDLATPAPLAQAHDQGLRASLGTPFRLVVAGAGLLTLLVLLPRLTIHPVGTFALLLLLAVLTEALLPLQLRENRAVSLTSTFTFLLFWHYGAVAAALGHATGLLARSGFRRWRLGHADPPLFTAFNAGQLSLSAIAAGVVVEVAVGGGLVTPAAGEALSLITFAAAFLVGNIVLTSIAVGLSRGFAHVRQVLWPTTSLWTAISFAFTAPLALAAIGLGHLLPVWVTTLLVFFALAGLNSIVQLNLELGARNAELRQGYVDLQTINESAESLTSQIELADLWPAIHHQIARLVRCDAFFIATFEGRGWQMEWVVEGNVAGPGAPGTFSGLIGVALRQSGSVVANDPAACAGLDAEPLFPGSFQPAALVAVPIQIGRRQLAVLSTQSAVPGVYSARQVALIETLAHSVAAALEHALLVERLRVALRDREEYLSVVSHELKNPIAAIRAYAQLAARRSTGEEDPRVLQAIDRIEDQTRRLERLVNDLLTLSRVESGQFELQLEPADLAAVAAESVETARASYPDRHFLHSIPAGPLQAQLDRARITQVIDNLISNAVKYSPPDRPIAVELKLSQRQARLSVRDEGQGIAPQDQARIFDRFYRVSDTSSTAPGLGVGLSVVREIVRAHGGDIELVSAPGAGSTFTVVLPLGCPD